MFSWVNISQQNGNIRRFVIKMNQVPIYQWIGLRENLEVTKDFPIEYGVFPWNFPNPLNLSFLRVFDFQQHFLRPSLLVPNCRSRQVQPHLFIQAVRWVHDHQMGFHQGLEHCAALEPTRVTSFHWLILGLSETGLAQSCAFIPFECSLCYTYCWRKFRSQTSDNMDRWKSEGGKSQGEEEKKWEDQRRRREKRRCRCAKR